MFQFTDPLIHDRIQRIIALTESDEFHPTNDSNKFSPVIVEELAELDRRMLAFERSFTC